VGQSDGLGVVVKRKMPVHAGNQIYAVASSHLAQVYNDVWK